MAVWSKVRFSQVSNEHRSDPEFFKPEYIHLDSYLHRIPDIDQLGNLSLFVKKGIFDISPNRYMNNGIPLIRTFQIKTPIVNNENLVFLSETDHAKLFSKTELLPGDMVFTKIGAGIGDVAVLPTKYTCYNFSQNVAGISINRSKINPYYLLAYLTSNIGRQQILRYMMPSGQGKLELRDIKKIRIVRLQNDEDDIAALVQKAEALIQDSSTLYNKAKLLLKYDLGIDKLRFQKPASYTAWFSDTITNRRFDSDYYQPQFTAIRQIVKKYPNGYEPLIYVATPLKQNIDPSKTPNKHYNYIELSNINASLGMVDGFVSKFGKDLPSRARRQVQHGDVIASAVVGSIDKAAVIDHAQNNYVASTGFFHLRPIKVSPEYLLMLVRSKCVCMQFQQESTGGILSAVPDSRLKNVIVPKLPERLQQEITTLVIQSHEAKKKSQELIDQAKTRVEQLIEEAVRR